MRMEKIAILDAGAQFGKVIDRKVRELNVESELLPLNTSVHDLQHYKSIIISGGPQSVYGDNAPKYDPELFSLDVPILGICYGMQLMNYVMGGKVAKKAMREDGQCEIEISNGSSLFKGLDKNQNVLMSHGDSIDSIAQGFEMTADSNGLVAAIEHKEKKLYGVQFHPEVDLTDNGKQVLKNFLYDISQLKGNFTMEDREKKAIRYIQDRVGNKNVLVLVSGGVDSTVCATLLKKAIGPERVYAIHVDNGLMRLNESDRVKIALEKIGLDLKVINAGEEFYNATTIIAGIKTGLLQDSILPEHKRKIIGDTFMRVADKVIRDLGLNPDDVYLAQGTLRPDLIESASKLASGKAEAIKTHHNDTELVRKLRSEGKVIEPLQEYHKDEVRQLGKSLGLPDALVWRQPFPGPGLGIRIICADKPYIDESFNQTNEALNFFTNYQRAPESFKRQLQENLFDNAVKGKEGFKKLETRLNKVNDIQATLLPIQTVGVQGDGRTYSYLAGLSGERNWDDLFFLANLIPKLCHNVNRLAYVFGEKVEGPVTEITQTYARPESILQLQKADDIVNKVLLDYDLLKSLSQVPVVSFPVNFGIEGNRSIAIRTFITNDFMTGVPARPGKEMPKQALDLMVDKILKEVPKISRVAYDLTSKPPGTTEWE